MIKSPGTQPAGIATFGPATGQVGAHAGGGVTGFGAAGFGAAGGKAAE